MPKINKYVDIDTVEREKKDLIDRHSPFIHCAATAKTGEPFEVTVKWVTNILIQMISIIILNL